MGDVMFKKRLSLPKILLATGFIWLIAFSAIVSAAQVTLQWDAIDTVPDGYRLYQRLSGFAYNYTEPAWSGTDTTCVIENLTPGASYYFVVRAFKGADESADSNEVQYTAAVIVEPDLDSDGDGWNDALDAFPYDSLEWLDTDSDGIGNNADEDDDGDGMPDIWELAHGLNPLVDDAFSDLDGDGTFNIDEYTHGSDPSNVPGNSAPAKPVLSRPLNGARTVGLTPTLMTGVFADADGDSHARTCYQISTTPDFSSLVFERTYTRHLTGLRVPDLILDPETTYYWRVKFYDNHNSASEWSDFFEFETLDYAAAGDVNGNGIIDVQEFGQAFDIDEDGTADVLQSGLQGVVTTDIHNLRVAVKRLSADVQVIGVMALDLDELPPANNQPEQLTGIISFKLLLLNDASTAVVTIFFSQPAPPDAKWFKFEPDEGWSDYANAVFSQDRKSVTLVLEDGGVGDQDGVRNGIIVDPSGLGYSTQSSEPSSYAPADAGGLSCFIAAAWPGDAKWAGKAVLLLAVIAILLGQAALSPIRFRDREI
ncbi:MAG: hypothetical protein C4519_14185 [Desulfobacteraceae bacterium]|nr:MAG: hypothetical protein C4519_14185 [Desulfobacteraceae bacterium]